MASTFTADPAAGTTVWVITTATTTCASAIRVGTVIQVRATEQTSGTVIKYDVRLGEENGTTQIAEANMYSTLGDASRAYFVALGGTLVGSPPSIP